MLAAVLQGLVAPSRAIGLPSLPRRLLDIAVPDRVGSRRAWERDGRAAIELGDGPDGDHRAVLAALSAVPGVLSVGVNEPMRRLVVTLGADAPELAELVAVVDRAEASLPARAEPESPARGGQPPRAGNGTAELALVADLAGIALAGAGALAGTLRLAAELASVVTLVDSQPRLRALVTGALGQAGGDTTLALSNAVAQGSARGWTSLGVDAVYRWSAVAEGRANAAAARAQARAHAGETRPPEPFRSAVAERPVPLPPGPVELWADRAAAVGGGALAVGWVATGNPRRAVDIALASLPKPGRYGREGFATQLGQVLGGRDAVVTDPAVLRRLDRIDTVVLDAEVLRTGRLVLGGVEALPGADSDEVAARLHALFDPTDPTAVQTGGGAGNVWTIGPVAADPVGPASQRLRRAGASQLLGISRGSELVALAALVPELTGSLDGLTAAADRAGLRLVTAGDPAGLPPALIGDVRPGGRRLAGTIHRLQADGAVVLLLSRRWDALAAADCGLAVDGAPATGAHVLLGGDLETAALVIEGCSAARTASRRSVRIAQAATALGGIATVAGGTSVLASRALLAVNVSAAAAFAQGAWAARELARRPITPPVSRTPWHAMPTDIVLATLRADPQGLSSAQAGQRRPPGERLVAPPGIGRAIVEELANPLTPILAGGAALSAAIGSTIDALLVIGVSGLSAVIGGLQRRGTDRALADLLSTTSTTARVHRDGSETVLAANELVPGDVITVLSGDVVPADGRVLDAYGLEVDESSLTGESLPVAKQVAPIVADAVADRVSMLYEGTTIAAGRGTAVVVATGTATEAGRSTAAAGAPPPPSGVETRLAQITRVTLPIAVGSAGAVVAAGLARGRALTQTVSASVTLAVGAVPEGLPFLVSAAQLAAARRLSKLGALVRNPRTIEALGRVDVLCFDKTGTLTEGRIELSGVADARTYVEVDRLGSRQRQVLRAGLRATPLPRPGHPLSDMTDRAVQRGARRAGVTRTSPGAPERWTRLAALPFGSSRGYHAILGDADGERVLSVKGAPEIILARCTAQWVGDRQRPLDDAGRRRLEDRAERLAGQGYRMLAVAERAGGAGSGPAAELGDDDLHDLTFSGFLALSDPARPAAGTSLAALRSAGVQVVMITGDHPRTAEAIARRLDILAGGRVVSGTELDALDDDALDRLLPDVQVVARGTPAHKVRVVQAFQRLRRVVAMTGDGANDAPAIRLADVGIALGRRGTAAARAAADLVVADDRLETIISGLVEGRAMWGSVREALAILVGGNLGEIAFTVLGALITGLSPLNTRQLLLINMLTDLAPALAVALRPPRAGSTAALLSEGPETSLGSALTRDVTARALTTATAAGTAWLIAPALGLGTAAGTIALATLVTTQLGQTLLAGRGSTAVLAAGLGSAAALAGVVEVPAVGAFFGSVPLGLPGWSLVLAAAAGGIALSPVLNRVLPTAIPLVQGIVRNGTTAAGSFAHPRIASAAASVA